MTPQERRMFAQLVALHGIVLESVTDYAQTKPKDEQDRILYHARKADEAMRKLFNSMRYVRTQEELEAIRRFVSRSQIYLLAPEDAETVQHLVEMERRWIEAEERGREYALSLFPEVKGE